MIPSKLLTSCLNLFSKMFKWINHSINIIFLVEFLTDPSAMLQYT